MALEALARYSERLNELDPELQPESRDEKAPHGATAHDSPARRRERAGQERQCLRVLHRAVPRDRVVRRIEAADAIGDAGDRHLVERHGDRRTGAASPESGAARPAQHRAVRRLSGRRHARPAAARRRTERDDPRPEVPVRAAYRRDRVDVRPCRLERNPALARRVRAAAAADVSRSRRAGTDGHPARHIQRKARLDRAHARARRSRYSSNHEALSFDGEWACHCVLAARH